MDMPHGRDLVPPRPTGRSPWRRRVVVVIVLAIVAVAVALLVLRDDEPAAVPAPCPAAPAAGVVLPEPSQVSVEVLNTTGVIGLAGRTGEELAARGFTVTKVDNLPGTVPDGPPLPRTEVHVQPGQQAAGELVALQLPDATVVQDAGIDVPVDVRLGVGFEAPLPPQEVARAVAERDGDARAQALAGLPARCREGAQ